MKSLAHRLFALCAALFFATAACAQGTELDQLVAPIALYPDALVAQVLAASTYPDEVAAAESWMRSNASLSGAQLAQAVNAQPWDPSVKALTQFPSVLANLAQNRAWTSSLGEAYASQPGAVMDAVQNMRRRAQATGNLRSTAQQTVTTQGENIVVEPASPSVVYLPAYDPWLAYGVPIAPYAGWVAVPGVYYAGPGLHWGLGFDVGLFAAFGWGWHHWGFDWHQRALMHDRAPWHSRNPAFAHRGPEGREFRGAPPRFEEPRAGGFEHGGFPHERPGFGGFREGGGFHGGGERR